MCREMIRRVQEDFGRLDILVRHLPFPGMHVNHCYWHALLHDLD